jgi:MarR family transcriptional regulator for hemolysin
MKTRITRDTMQSDRSNAKTGARPPTPPPGNGARRARGRQLPDDDNWDKRLGFLMHDVSRLRRAAFDEYMKPTGVTRSQWWVLAQLRHDGMIQSDLADALEIGKASLGGLVDRLEASGLIERRPDANDRRVKRIYLSSQGKQMVKEMTQLSHEMSEQILDGLSVDERHALADMLGLVKANLLRIRGTQGTAGKEEEEDL